MRNPMFELDDSMADAVIAYCRERLSLDPVPLDYGGARESFHELLDGLIGPQGHSFEEVLAVFEEHLATAVISCDSPRFLSFIPAAPTKAALLFDMVVSSSSLHGSSWLEAAGAVAAENQALRVLADMAGLPAGAGGVFVAGGTLGNLSALVVARDTAARRRTERTGVPRIAVSEEAHSSVATAFHVIGVEPFLVPVADHRLTEDALRRALAGGDHADNVVGVVATAGTTNAGIIDDLDGVATVATERDWWFHVDGAYGGAALMVPEMRTRFRGIERADSFIVDPHKWLFAPFDCAALLYRDPRLARASHTQDASYLDVLHDVEREVWNPSDYAIHLTRRARGMPLWFSLAVHGTDAYADAIATVLGTAQDAARLIERTPYVELVRQPELSVVLFRRSGWERQDYDRWSSSLLAQQVALVLPTTWEGDPVARLAFLHPDTSIEMVGEILDTMR